MVSVTSQNGKHAPWARGAAFPIARDPGGVVVYTRADSPPSPAPKAATQIIVAIARRFAASGKLKAFPERPTLWNLDARLKMMDEFEGLQQILSLANPPIEQIGGPEVTPQIARIANDGLAELCDKHPQRFPAFIASMPNSSAISYADFGSRAST